MPFSPQASFNRQHDLPNLAQGIKCANVANHVLSVTNGSILSLAGIDDREVCALLENVEPLDGVPRALSIAIRIGASAEEIVNAVIPKKATYGLLLRYKRWRSVTFPNSMRGCEADKRADGRERWGSRRYWQAEQRRILLLLRRGEAAHKDTNAPVLKLARFDAADGGRGYEESPGVNKTAQHEASSGRLGRCRPFADHRAGQEHVSCWRSS